MLYPGKEVQRLDTPCCHPLASTKILCTPFLLPNALLSPLGGLIPSLSPVIPFSISLPTGLAGTARRDAFRRLRCHTLRGERLTVRLTNSLVTSDLQDIKGNWKKLGSGSFGNVYKGAEVSPGEDRIDLTCRVRVLPRDRRGHQGGSSLHRV